MTHLDKYLNIGFSSELNAHEYYVYEKISDLVVKCDKNRDKISKCRTIGILESKYGKFYMKDINLHGSSNRNEPICIIVSMIYLKQPLLSVVKPQTIQLFGTLQWKNKPIIYASFVQILTPPIASQLFEAMQSVVDQHLAKQDSKMTDFGIVM